MTIKQNKVQSVLYFVFSLMFTAASLCFSIFDIRKIPHEESFVFDNPFAYWTMKALCLVFGIFFVAVCIYLFKQLFSKEPLIEICDEYFYDNSSAISLGKMDWSDMECVYIKSNFLNIKLKDPTPYFKNKNWLQMLMIKINHKLGYGDACIGMVRFKKRSASFLKEFAQRRSIGQSRI